MVLLGLIFWGIVTLPILIVLLLVIKVRRNGEYFRKQNVHYIGNVFYDTIRFILGYSHIIDMEEDLYQRAVATKAPLVGMSDFAGAKGIYVFDLELLRSIYVKDFDHFVNRRPIGTEHGNEYLTKMMISTENEVWKGTRSKLSPCFTTGKIKRMFQIFKTSSERMDAYLKEQINYPTEKSMDIDFLDIISKYTIDVIASCAFGIDSKSFEVNPDQKSVFEKMSKQFGFQFTPKQFLSMILVIAFPKVAEKLGVQVMDKESEKYLVGVIKEVMKRRRQTGERRDDFLQLMMDVQQGLLKEDEESKLLMNGTVAGEEGKQGESITGDVKYAFEDDNIIANGIQFLNAGSDTTQSVLLFTLYCLAREPDVQNKLYEEIKTVMEKNGGQVTYDAVNEMKYLDLVLNESLRAYSPATRTERICTKDYPVPGTNAVIEKGTVITIPIHGIHHDKRYYSNPEKFDPERFTAENKASRHPYAFTPFGLGPRNCIGNRFALVKARAVLAQLVYSYQFAPCSKTMIPMKYDRNPIIKPKGSMWLNVTVRNN